GAIAGWLANQLLRGTGFKLPRDILVGVAGAVIAAYLLPKVRLHLGGGIVASIVAVTPAAMFGAALLLLIVWLVKRASPESAAPVATMNTTTSVETRSTAAAPKKTWMHRSVSNDNFIVAIAALVITLSATLTFRRVTTPWSILPEYDYWDNITGLVTPNGL